MTNTKSGLLVIGIGNRYQSDDRAGLAAAGRLMKKGLPEVTVLELEGDGAVLMELWKGAGKVILLDAVHAGGPPGGLYRYDASENPLPARFFKHSTHAFGVPEAVELSRALESLPETLVVYGIEGRNFGAGMELTFQVEQRIGDLVECVVREINGRLPDKDHLSHA